MYTIYMLHRMLEIASTSSSCSLTLERSPSWTCVIVTRRCCWSGLSLLCWQLSAVWHGRSLPMSRPRLRSHSRQNRPPPLSWWQAPAIPKVVSSSSRLKPFKKVWSTPTATATRSSRNVPATVCAGSMSMVSSARKSSFPAKIRKPPSACVMRVVSSSSRA
jgi:hypothetical protein